MTLTSGGTATVRRTAARSTIVAVLVAVFSLGLATNAFASGSWATDQYAQCSKAWNWNRYGANAFLHEHYTADTSNHSVYIESNGESWVDALLDCGPGGYVVDADRIVLRTTFSLGGTGLNCSVSIGGATCSATYTNVTYTFEAKCQFEVPRCTHNFGTLDFYAPHGGTYNRGVLMQTWCTLIRTDGSSYTWSTAGI